MLTQNDLWNYDDHVSDSDDENWNTPSQNWEAEEDSSKRKRKNEGGKGQPPAKKPATAPAVQEQQPQNLQEQQQPRIMTFSLLSDDEDDVLAVPLAHQAPAAVDAAAAGPSNRPNGAGPSTANGRPGNTVGAPANPAAKAAAAISPETAQVLAKGHHELQQLQNTLNDRDYVDLQPQPIRTRYIPRVTSLTVPLEPLRTAANSHAAPGSSSLPHLAPARPTAAPAAVPPAATAPAPAPGPTPTPTAACADKLTLKCQWGKDKSVGLRIRASDKLSKLMSKFKTYATEKDLMPPGARIIFKFDGDRLKDGDTAEGLGLEADDVIDVQFAA